MKQTDIKIISRLLTPLIIFLIIVAVTSIYSFKKFELTNLSSLSKKSYLKTTQAFHNKFNNDIKIYQDFIELISKDEKAINFFQSANKEALYNYYLPQYTKWKVKYNLSHFYFHNTNKINFLRVHNQKKNGDLINRVTLNNAIKNRGLGYGIEFGISHNLTLRVVYPWIVKDKIIGYIELGKEIDYFTPELAKLEHVDIVFTIDKDKIKKSDYDKWLSHSKENKKFNELNNHYIIDATFIAKNENLLTLLDSKKELNSILVNNEGKYYYLNSRDFKDVSGHKIGQMYTLNNVSANMDNLNHLIILITVIMTLLILVLIYYYYKLIEREEIFINKKQENIIKMTIKDGLTGLYNKKCFEDDLLERILEAKNSNLIISLIILDIDNFKKYNDNYGHLKGDEAIKKVAEIIKKIFKRSNDRCYRIGGEEFAIIIISEEKNVASSMAKLTCKNVQESNIEHLYNEDFNCITISIGVCSLEAKELVTSENIFISADKALYKAKHSGRNNVISVDAISE